MSATIRSRPSPSRNKVLAVLRQEIAAGTLPPGSRLPIRTELGERFQVSVVTLQSALDCLMRDGFVESKGKLGTFVVKRPPFLTNYGLVFPFHPGGTGWTGLWTAMALEAQAMEADGRLGSGKIPQYFDISDGHPDNATYQGLLQKVQEHGLAGLIFASSPHLIEETPLVQEPGIPRVVISYGPPTRFPTMWLVDFDGAMFRDKALDYLASRGRKRVAFLHTPGQYLYDRVPVDLYAHALEKRDMITHEYWRLYVSQEAAFGARNCVNLLMQGTPQERPDALIIADDNLVDHAVAGLLMSGVRVGVDVDVVAHANFPLPGPSEAMPLRRLGFDVRQIMTFCKEAIDRQRAGETEQQVLMVPAVWEDQVLSATNTERDVAKRNSS